MAIWFSANVIFLVVVIWRSHSFARKHLTGRLPRSIAWGQSRVPITTDTDLARRRLQRNEIERVV